MIYILGFLSMRLCEQLLLTIIKVVSNCEFFVWVKVVFIYCILSLQNYHYLTCNIHLYKLNLVASLKKIVQTVTSIILVTAAAAKSRQSCPTLCDPIDSSPPGSRPWDSPGKNTGVGCRFLLQCMKVKSESEVAQLCPTLCVPMDCSPLGSSVHGTLITKAMQKIALCQNQYLCHILNISRGSQIQFC